MTKQRVNQRTPQHLTSAQNPILKRARRLKTRADRDETGLFRIEGYREIERALDAGVEFQDLIYCDTNPRFERCKQTLTRIVKESDASTYTTNNRLFSSLSQWQNPDGLLVIAHQPPAPLSKLQSDSDGVYLVVDGIEKPGNLGSMFRSADASGCSGLLISDPIVDVFNPNVIRASLGTSFTVPYALAESGDVRRWLHSQGIAIISTSPDAETNYLDLDLAKRCAIVIGSEKDGLSDDWLEDCDSCVRLPNEGFADSLNAAMTANVMLFESYRQRINS